MRFQLPDLQYLGIEIKQWWERLGVRKWINQHPRIIIGTTTASVLVLLIVVISVLIPEKTIEVEDYAKEWFYDLNTGSLFVARKGLIPPIKAPSGPLPSGAPAGVRAYVFSYVDEPNEAERFIGFIETTDPNAEERELGSAGIPVGGAKQWGRGRLIRRLGDEQWVPANSPQGRLILRKIFLPNEAGELARYYPPD